MTQKMAQAEDDLLYCKAQQQVGGFERIIVNATFLVATGELKNACVDWYVVSYSLLFLFRFAFFFKYPVSYQAPLFLCQGTRTSSALCSTTFPTTPRTS